MRVSARSWLVALCAASVAVLGCTMLGPRVDPADLVLTNGKVVTVDPAKPEAEALAVRGGRIESVGTIREIKAYIGPKTQIIDLAGRLAIPGFIESHAHFTGVGNARMQLDLTTARTWDEIAAKVAAAAAKAGPATWILGRGWHQEKWDRPPSPAVSGFPTEALLSKAAPDHPVLLTHASGHATIANAKAMELAGITRRTPNPPGGEILKDAAGNPAGVFIETASGLLRRAFAEAQSRRTPQQVEADADREIELADEEYISKGVTTVHDAGVSFEDVDRYKRFVDAGKLRVRLYVMLGEDNARLAAGMAKYRMIGAGNQHLTVRAVKRLIDGALGSRGAWLLAPYADQPKSTGLQTTPTDVMNETARLAIENGFQVCTHAIGDRANRETLDIYEAAFKAHPDKRDVRWRIEHAQHLSAADIPRFGRLGVIASMQGIHCTSDAPFVLARLGPERAEEGAYVWQKLLRSGARIANGTDAPVEATDPLPGYRALVTRQQKNGQVFYADQRMTRAEALDAYTLSGAYAAFEEAIKGSLTAGKLADITVLSSDITAVPEDDILKAKVAYTIVGGKVVYQAQ